MRKQLLIEIDTPSSRDVMDRGFNITEVNLMSIMRHAIRLGLKQLDSDITLSAVLIVSAGDDK